MLLGCELDWLGKDETRALHASDFDRFDVVLGSIHFVDRWLMVSHKNMSTWKSVDLEAFWKRYVELWCEAAKSDMPFTVMAHADVVKKFSPKPEFDLEPLYERMARAAREGGRMVEVNTSGAYAECSEYYPSPSLLQAFRAEGVACTVGTDAHCKEHIARDIERAYDYMRAAGYTQLAVPTRGRGVRMVDL